MHAYTNKTKQTETKPATQTNWQKPHLLQAWPQCPGLSVPGLSVLSVPQWPENKGVDVEIRVNTHFRTARSSGVSP